MSRTTIEILQDALAHFEIMQTHAELGLEERLVIDAVCMRLSAGIEALAAIDSDEREDIFGEVWPLMWGMRNRNAHGDLLVDTTIIRETLIHDVPSIMSRIRQRVLLHQSAAIGDERAVGDAALGEPTHVDRQLKDTRSVGSAGASESDRD